MFTVVDLYISTILGFSGGSPVSCLQFPGGQWVRLGDDGLDVLRHGMRQRQPRVQENRHAGVQCVVRYAIYTCNNKFTLVHSKNIFVFTIKVFNKSVGEGRQ